jgi:DNA primase
MKYPQEIIEKIRDRAEIVEVIGEDVSLKPKGSNYVGLSPFNDEKTPSFVVSPQKRIYKDFSSGKSGNVFTWIMEFHGMNFIEAVRTLAKKYAIQLPDINTEVEAKKYEKEDLALKAVKAASDYFSEQLKSKEGRKALSYFIDRGFTKDIIDTFQIGYAPDSWSGLSDHLLKMGFNENNLLDAGLIIKKDSGGFYDRFRGREMFTIRDFLGRPVGFGARRMNEDKEQPKYINSPQTIIYDKSKILYGLSEGKNAIRNNGEAILVEGYADVITLYQHGIENVVASSGTALTEQQVKLIKRYAKKLFVIYDSDPAGIKAAEKGAEIALSNDLEPNIVRLPEGEDPDSLVKENGPKALKFFLKDAANYVDFIIDNRKKSGEYSSPSEQADLIREITKTIAKIPDKLQHHFYLRRAATKLELSEAQLQQVYEEAQKLSKKDKKVSSQKVEKETEEKSKDFIYNDFFVNHEVAITNALHFVPIDILKIIKRDELIIFKLLITKDNPLIIIENKYDLKVDDFYSDFSKSIFSKIYEIASENENIFDFIFSNQEMDKNHRNLLSALALNIFELSKKHGDSFLEDESFYEEVLEKSVFNLRVEKDFKRRENILDLIKENPINKNDLLIELKDLNIKLFSQNPNIVKIDDN